MWNNCLYNTRVFTKLNKMKKSDIEGVSGTQLARILAFFSTSIQSEPKPCLDVKTLSFDSRSPVEDYWNNFFMLGKKGDFAFCKVLKDRNYNSSKMCFTPTPTTLRT